MTSYIPKYQFSAIAARRAGRAERRSVTLQRMLKSGGWGKPFQFEMRKSHTTVCDGGSLGFDWETEEEALARFCAMNEQYTVRIAK